MLETLRVSLPLNLITNFFSPSLSLFRHRSFGFHLPMESSATTAKPRSKKRGFKTRLFLCFKPVSSVDDALEPAAYSSILSSALTTVAECNEGGGSRCWRRKGNDDHSLWRQVLKKALNETTLLKKIKNRKAANKNQSSTSKKVKLERKTGKISKEERKNNPSSSDSSASSSFLSSSFLTGSSVSSWTSSSSRTLASTSTSTSSSVNNSGNICGFTVKRHEDAKDIRKGLGSNYRNKALCLVMITSLLVLILWGKLFAIIYTTFWFYLVPRRSEQCNRPAGGKTEVKEFDSVEYKKKIIMEGLLERNRSRLSIDSIAKS